MLSRPRRQRRGGAIRHEVAHRVGLKVDADGAVPVPLAARPSVHAQDAHRSGGWEGGSADQAEQGPGTPRRALCRRRGSAARTAQREGRAQPMHPQACGAAGTGHDEVRQPCGEEFAPTPAHAAHTPADVAMEDDPVPRAGTVGQRARVRGMPAPGAALAERAARPAPRRDDLQMNGGPVAPQALAPPPCDRSKEQVGAHSGCRLSPGVRSPWSLSLPPISIIESA
jgi:hypothetical protein